MGLVSTEEEEREEFVCPECGLPLCHSISKDRHGNMVIEVFCDDDHLRFKILTKISDKDIDELEKKKPVKTEVTMKLQYRLNDEEAENYNARQIENAIRRTKAKDGAKQT